MGIVYLIRLDRPLESPKPQARFYLGSCLNLNHRMKQHRSGNGSAMLRSANNQGIPYRACKFEILSTASEARRLERRLKAQKNHRSLLTKDWSRYL